MGSFSKTSRAFTNPHKSLSVDKAESMGAEFDRIVAICSKVNPLMFHEREADGRVYSFGSGTYVLCYKELDTIWLVAGVFQARRYPS